MREIIPSFTKQEQDRVTERTGTSYAEVASSAFFEDRGINHRGNLELLLELSKVGMVAGGFFESILRGENPKDIDIFFKDAGQFVRAYEWLTSNNEFKYFTDTNLVDVTQETRFVEFKDEKNLLPNIQLIKTAWYDSPETVIDSFDFTAAQFAMEQGYVTFNPLAALDVARKRLVLHRMTFPASTLRRMIKYTQKGYYVCPGSLQKIALATQEVLTRVGQDANGKVYID